MEEKEKDEEEFWEDPEYFDIVFLPLGSSPPSLTEQDWQEMKEEWEKEMQRRLQEESKDNPVLF